MNVANATHDIVVLLPVRGAEGLATLGTELNAAGFGAIIVVVDGLTCEEEPALEAVAGIPRVHLIRHAASFGKGRALKTGMNFFLTHLQGFSGLVTVDPERQHTIEDIVRVANALAFRAGSVVFGCRRFSGDLPLRCRLENELTRLVFHFFSGKDVSDTQSGLCGYPAHLLPEILGLPGERYEYEMTILGYLTHCGVRLVEVPIETVRSDGNHPSHFNPARDSMRTGFALARFYASSLVSAGLDLVGFCLMLWATHNLLWAMLLGRLSTLLNFALNRRFVFHYRGSFGKALWKYYLLAAFLATVSYGAMCGFSSWLGWNVILVKMATETPLSLLNFSVQKVFVFADDRDDKERKWNFF